MRKLLILAVIMILAAFFVAQTDYGAENAGRHGSDEVVSTSAADDAILRRASEEWRDAYNAKDAARVASLYTEDGYYVSAHISAHGREAIRGYFQRGIDAGGHIEAVQILETHSDGRLAYTVGTYDANNAGQKVSGRILLVLVKRGDHWLIAAHQVVVPDQP